MILDDIPLEVIQAAQLVGRFFEERNIKVFELGPVRNRNAPVAQPLTAAQITAEAQGRYSNNASAQAFATGALWAALRVTGGAA